jgi:protein SCO1/2
MTRRLSRLIILAAAFALGILACVGLVLVMTGHFTNTPALQQAAVGGPFKLVDENGRPFTDEDLKGKPFLVFFGFTHCPDVCPTSLFELSEILRGLGPDANKISALFISVDPERDTPAVLKDYLSSFDPHLRGLTGSPEAIAAAAKEYRAYYKKVPLEDGDYTMDHSALVYLMDKDGRFIAPFNIKQPPAVADAELRKYL